MKRIIAALVTLVLVAGSLPATAQSQDLEERNREWLSENLLTGYTADKMVDVRTEDGFETKPASWIVDQLAERAASYGFDLSTTGETSGDETNLAPEGFPVASSFIFLAEEAIVDSFSEASCNQGGGGTGGHYGNAAPTPVAAFHDSATQVQGPLAPVGPTATVQAQAGAAVLPLTGNATSTFSYHTGISEVFFASPMASASLGAQTLTVDQHFDYDDKTIAYSGTSDFWCIEFIPWGGPPTVLNAPFLSGEIHEIPS